MKILVLGSGAREHAIILALRSEQAAHDILAAPGNAGIGRDATLVSLDPNDPVAVTTFAMENTVDLVVIGPEAPLVAGVADALRIPPRFSSGSVHAEPTAICGLKGPTQSRDETRALATTRLL